MYKNIIDFIENYKRWFGYPLVFVMSVAALSLAVIRPSFIENIELKTLDERFVMRGPIEADKRVIIVAVDDNSLTEVGRWPWSRDKISELTDKILGQYGAKSLGFDIVFSEAQLNPIRESMRLIQGDEKSKEIQWLGKYQVRGDLDDHFEKVLESYREHISLGYFFYPKGGDTPSMALENMSRFKGTLQNSALSTEYSEDAEDMIPRIDAVEGNLHRFGNAVDAVAFFNFFPDVDGMVRRVPMVVELDGDVFPSLSLQTLRLFLDWPSASVKVWQGGVESIHLGDHTVLTDQSGGMILNHYGPGQTFTHIPAADILAGRVEENALKDAIIVLGVTARGVYDYRPSPFDSVFPGVEGHAAAISNILNDEAIHRPASLEIFELLGVFLISLTTGLLVYRRGPVIQSISIFGVPLIILGLSLWLFSEYGLWLKVVYLVMGVLMTTVPVTLLEYMAESGKRAFIHDAFSRYLAPEVVDRLTKNPDALKLGGEERQLTAMFSDIASFSSFSEKMTPVELVNFLNEYLTAMSDLILERGGTIDKYEGDAVMAFFGAPVDMLDNATQCVLSALEQQSLLSVLRKRWCDEGHPEVHIRIGVNSGPMVVGNMGTPTRMNYTIMGDHVNLASRLEGVCKQYRVPILMSRETYMEAREKVSSRFVDRVRVVGRSKPVDLYEPLGLRDEVPADVIERSRTYEQAWTLMRDREFVKAGEILSHLFADYPEDGLYEVMLERVNELKRNPPPADWDAIFNLSSK
ncbi:MAG: adenylate/guanylate cyclase domain-containing protein [Mariprofundaceae bacterium]